MCSGIRPPGKRNTFGSGNIGTIGRPIGLPEDPTCCGASNCASASDARGPLRLARLERAREDRELARFALLAADLRAARQVRDLALQEHRVLRVAQPRGLEGDVVLLEVLPAVELAARLALVVR